MLINNVFMTLHGVAWMTRKPQNRDLARLQFHAIDDK